MTIWHQACSIDGKIRSFDAIKETTQTLTIYSASKGREVTINKRSDAMFCSENWLIARGWLIQKTHDELTAERVRFAAIQQKHGHLRCQEDIAAMFAARRKLSQAQSVHGHAKGQKEPA